MEMYKAGPEGAGWLIQFEWNLKAQRLNAILSVLPGWKFWGVGEESGGPACSPELYSVSL